MVSGLLVSFLVTTCISIHILSHCILRRILLLLRVLVLLSSHFLDLSGYVYLLHYSQLKWVLRYVTPGSSSSYILSTNLHTLPSFVFTWSLLHVILDFSCHFCVDLFHVPILRLFYALFCRLPLAVALSLSFPIGPAFTRVLSPWVPLIVPPYCHRYNRGRSGPLHQ